VVLTQLSKAIYCGEHTFVILINPNLRIAPFPDRFEDGLICEGAPRPTPCRSYRGGPAATTPDRRTETTTTATTITTTTATTITITTAQRLGRGRVNTAISSS
jgi:hypothetical protein